MRATWLTRVSLFFITEKTSRTQLKSRARTASQPALNNAQALAKLQTLRGLTAILFTQPRVSQVNTCPEGRSCPKDYLCPAEPPADKNYHVIAKRFRVCRAPLLTVCLRVAPFNHLFQNRQLSWRQQVKSCAEPSKLPLISQSAFPANQSPTNSSSSSFFAFQTQNICLMQKLRCVRLAARSRAVA